MLAKWITKVINKNMHIWTKYRFVCDNFFTETIVHRTLAKCHIMHWNKTLFRCRVIFLRSSELRLRGSNEFLTPTPVSGHVTVHWLVIGHRVVMWHLAGWHHWLRVSWNYCSIACCVCHLHMTATHPRTNCAQNAVDTNDGQNYVTRWQRQCKMKWLVPGVDSWLLHAGLCMDRQPVVHSMALYSS